MSDNEDAPMGGDDGWDNDIMGEDDMGIENNDLDITGQQEQPGVDFIESQTENKSGQHKEVPKDQRQTTPFMTKYERARVLGTRALHIAIEIFKIKYME